MSTPWFDLFSERGGAARTRRVRQGRRELSATAAPASSAPPDPDGGEPDPGGEAHCSPSGACLQAEPEHGAQGKVEDDGGEDVERDAAGSGRAALLRGAGAHEAKGGRPDRRVNGSGPTTWTPRPRTQRVFIGGTLRVGSARPRLPTGGGNRQQP